jgi:hypothetical protein
MSAIVAWNFADQSSSGKSTAPQAPRTKTAPTTSHLRWSFPRTSAWPPVRQSTSHTVLEHIAARTSLG